MASTIHTKRLVCGSRSTRYVEVDARREERSEAHGYAGDATERDEEVRGGAVAEDCDAIDSQLTGSDDTGAPTPATPSRLLGPA